MKSSWSALLCMCLLLLATSAFAWQPYQPSDSDLRRMVMLLPQIGELAASEHHSLVAIRVGEPYRAGKMAFFTVYGGQIIWGLEEWESLPEGKFRVVYWRFRFDEKSGYTHVTTGESLILSGRIAIDKTYEVLIDIASGDERAQIASEKSRLVWELLKHAGKPA